MKLKYLMLSFLLIPVSVTFTYSQNQEPKKESTFKRAERYFFQKKFEMAEILLQEELKKNPENAQAYAYLGDIFLKKKRYDGALNLYRKAIDLEPSNGANYFRIGQIYYYKKLGALAIENFRKSYELDNTLKFAMYHIGLSYLMLERDKMNTISHWETYLRIAPEDPQYERIRRVIELLKDPNFKIPPKGSDIPIEEALLLGGATLQKADRVSEDKKAGHAEKKTNKKMEGLYLDDDDL